MRISSTRCKKHLAMLWFIGSGFIFVIVLLQTIFGRYEEKATEAWAWFLPTIMPTLLLIIGVLVMDTLERGEKKQTVDRFIFWLSFSISLIYLIVVALTIFMQPFSNSSALELMKQSNLWLGPFQGLVSASLGAFYTTQRGN